MCCFSGPVKSVTDTNLFARAAAGTRQYLVYEMTFEAAADLAMILPLPVPPRSPEDAVRFIALDGYRDFFADMRKGFPTPVSRGGWTSLGIPVAKSQSLRVVEVGDFEASFVPAITDFDRLDERFRLPYGIWFGLPAYADFGFAVFKLKRGIRTVHPMAFEFPRRDPAQLFFPTVHIHDGVVHAQAAFDHSLYCQADAAPRAWRVSEDRASTFMKSGTDGGVVDPARHVYLRAIHGTHANEDIHV
jgi:hypothetical protein